MTCRSVPSCSRPVGRRTRGPRTLGVLVAGLALVGLAACSDDDDPSRPQGQPVLDVEDATCLLVDAGIGAEVTELPVVDCAVEHTHEVFATVTDEVDDVYPGMSALEAFAERECYARFEKYVGVNPFDSSLSITWIVPSLDGWNDEDDHDVLCVLASREGVPLTGSARDSKL